MIIAFSYLGYEFSAQNSIVSENRSNQEGIICFVDKCGGIYSGAEFIDGADIQLKQLFSLENMLK